MRIMEIQEGMQLYDQAFDLRYELFFKEFDLPRSVTADDLEPVSTHIALTNKDDLLAYGRLSPLGADTYRISQIVVSPSHRREGHATAIINELISRARNLSADEVVLNSQVSVMLLYEKLGFQPIGEIYPSKSTGVPHQKMRLELRPEI